MQKVKAKKFLGQHFLNDESVAERIANTLMVDESFSGILEVGPGMGVLTKYLLSKYESSETKAIELDRESVEYLNEHYPSLEVISNDFLKINLSEVFDKSFALIGNYPYNISSQIVFKTLENKDQIPLMTGMFQKEVAERICAGPGSKTYGVISVLTQAYYKAEYLFTVSPDVFTPPPKVQSGVMRLTRLKSNPDCSEKQLRMVVKQAFNQRRKTLRNSLKSLYSKEYLQNEIFNLRPETLSVEQFVELTNAIEKH